MATRKKKKPFFKSGVGRTLLGALKFIPGVGGLVSAVEGASSVEEALAAIQNSQEISPEDKYKLQEIALMQYEAEVQDRVSARDREIAVAVSGGNDVLFKVIGFGITFAFLAVVLYAIGVLPQPDNVDRDFLLFASGSVSSAFMAVISYYFGSSVGSKQKTDLMKTN